MKHHEVVSTTRAFIVENFLYTRPDFFIDEDLPLLGEGIVDSMGVMEVIMFLETEFGVTTEGRDIREENLGSLGRISRWVLSQKQRETGELNAAQVMGAA